MIPVFAILGSTFLLCCTAVADSFPQEAANCRTLKIDQSKRVAGRMASTGYLRGKIVMLADFDFADESRLEEFKSLEDIWQAYKSKNFVMLGAHGGGSTEKARNLLTGNGITFPVYEDVWRHRGKEPLQEIIVFGIMGKAVFRGPSSKHARAAAGAQIISSRVHTTVESYAEHIDFFLDILPGKAFNLLKDFKKDFPSEFGRYGDVYKRLAANEDVVRLAKLENICRQALDYEPSQRRGKKALTAERVEAVMQFYGFLSTNKVESIAQEAKNCIAELKWLHATL